MLVIQNTKDRDLFWSNEDGWTDRDSADEFKEIETGTLDLPMGAEWVSSYVGLVYKIMRCYADPNKESEFVKGGLTYDEAREHCSDPSTSGTGWFDAFYEEES